MLTAFLRQVFVFCCAHNTSIRDYLLSSKIWNVVDSGASTSDEIKDAIIEGDDSGDNAEKVSGECVEQSVLHPSPRVFIDYSDMCMSAGDVLRELDAKNVITSDPFVLVSGDVISNLNLKQAVAAHKERREKDKTSIMSVVMKSASPRHPTRRVQDDLVVALNRKTNQLLLFDDNPSSSSVQLPVGVIKEHVALQFRYDLLDCHIDICSPEVMIHFSDNYDYQDIRRNYHHHYHHHHHHHHHHHYHQPSSLTHTGYHRTHHTAFMNSLDDHTRLLNSYLTLCFTAVDKMITRLAQNLGAYLCKFACACLFDLVVTTNFTFTLGRVSLIRKQGIPLVRGVTGLLLSFALDGDSNCVFYSRCKQAKHWRLPG